MLRHRALLAAVCGAAIPAALFAFSAGPPPGSSGVPAAGNNQAENTCALCHSDSEGGQAGKLNPDALGKIELRGVPAKYVPGHSYPLEIHVSHPEAQRWGFQLTAVAGDDLHGAGDFAPLPNDKTTQKVVGLVAARNYIEHGATGKATGVGQKGQFGWKFTWIAPTGNEGKVSFYGVFNASNGDGSNGGDKIYAPVTGVLASSEPGK